MGRIEHANRWVGFLAVQIHSQTWGRLLYGSGKVGSLRVGSLKVGSFKAGSAKVGSSGVCPPVLFSLTFIFYIAHE